MKHGSKFRNIWSKIFSCFEKEFCPSLALSPLTTAIYPWVPEGLTPRGRRDWNQNYMEHLENTPEENNEITSIWNGKLFNTQVYADSWHFLQVVSYR